MNENTPTQPPKSPESRFQKLLRSRKALVIGLVLLLAVILVILLVVRSASGPGGPTDGKSNNISQDSRLPKPLEFDIDDEAQIESASKEISTYIASQKRPDGFYNSLAHYDEQCTEQNGKEECPYNNQEFAPVMNSWATLSNLAEYKMTGNKAYLDQAVADSEKLRQWCASDSKKCLWVLVQQVKLYEETKDSELLEFLEAEGNELIRATPSQDLMLLSIETRSLVLLYDITDDPKYLNAAQVRMQDATALLPKQPYMYDTELGKMRQGVCWYTLAWIDLAQATNNRNDYINVSQLLDGLNLPGNIYQIQNPIGIQPCIESYANLSTASGNPADMMEAKQLMSLFLNSFWDSRDRPLIYGEGGTRFMQFPEGIGKSSAKYVTLTDSAYTNELLYLLSK